MGHLSLSVMVFYEFCVTKDVCCSYLRFNSSDTFHQNVFNVNSLPQDILKQDNLWSSCCVGKFSSHHSP